jgi:exopolysaccharide production protein ExoF
MLAGVVCGQGGANAADYQLDALDKLHIRVAEWRTAEGAVRDWLSLTGDYTVGTAGTISLPFIGEMPVAGKTTAEVATSIGDQLQQKFGLIDRPDASVEIAEFRPFFISGEVQSPGRYPYVPGLTVLKAITLAGGQRRPSDQGQVRDFISSRGNYQALVAQHDSLLARRARLVAEATGKEEIDFPQELEQSQQGKKLMADETAFKAAREKRLNVQLASLADLKKLLDGEVASLATKIATQGRQVDLLQEELANVGSLAEQGLVVKQRILSLQQQIADLQGKVIDMETASLRAKQDASRAVQDANTAQNNHATDIAQDRQQTEAELEQVEVKIAMNRELMSEAVSRDPTVALSAGGTPGTAVLAMTYSIVREKDGKQTEVAADEAAEVLPGDVVKVTLPLAPAD